MKWAGPVCSFAAGFPGRLSHGTTWTLPRFPARLGKIPRRHGHLRFAHPDRAPWSMLIVVAGVSFESRVVVETIGHAYVPFERS